MDSKTSQSHSQLIVPARIIFEGNEKVLYSLISRAAHVCLVLRTLAISMASFVSVHVCSVAKTLVPWTVVTLFTSKSFEDLLKSVPVDGTRWSKHHQSCHQLSCSPSRSMLGVRSHPCL